MKKYFLPLFVFSLLSFDYSYSQVSAKARVTLNPVGNFTASTVKVQGSAVKTPKGFKADEIIVDLKSLETGISLRDKHAKEKYLEVEKYPKAVVKNAVGENGTGTATFALRGIEKPIKGTYKVKDNFLTAEFKIKLDDYKIENISYKGIGVENEVDIEVTLPIKSAGPSK